MEILMLVKALINVIIYSKVLISIKLVNPLDSIERVKLDLDLCIIKLGTLKALQDLILLSNSPKGSKIYSLLDSVVIFWLPFVIEVSMLILANKLLLYKVCDKNKEKEEPYGNSIKEVNKFLICATVL